MVYLVYCEERQRARALAQNDPDCHETHDKSLEPPPASFQRDTFVFNPDAGVLTIPSAIACDVDRLSEITEPIE